MRLGVIANPLSHRNKRGLDHLEQTIQDETELIYCRLDDFAGLAANLREMAQSDVGALVICGGDGTVQAVLTELVEARPFETLPHIAVVPCGMTNMIAADVGVRGPADKAIRRVLGILRDGQPNQFSHPRRLLRLENIDGYAPQVGMFFGGAGIYRAIQACRQKVHGMKFEAELANGLTLVWLVLRWLLRGRRPDDVFHGDSVGVGIDGADLKQQDCLIVLAATLDKLVLNSRPFWNLGDGDFYLTTVQYPPPKLARSIFRLLSNGDKARLPRPGYNSCGVKRAELAMDCPFTLDGQLFRPAADKPLVITAPVAAQFLRA